MRFMGVGMYGCSSVGTAGAALAPWGAPQDTQNRTPSANWVPQDVQNAILISSSLNPGPPAAARGLFGFF
jgi:hypothetical protein